MPSAPQTSYTDRPPVAVAGHVAENDPNNKFISRTAEAALGFGRFVTKGTLDRQAAVIDAAGDVTKGLLLGVTVFEAMRMAKTPPYAIGDMVRILRRGLIWVEAAAAVTAGQPGYVVHTGADAGLIRGTADASATILDGLTIQSDGADGDLVLVEVYLP